MPEMRKCKECGKMFMPKGREQYCSDVHYRPCPICGAPVVAKYLSDPPRKCGNCRGRKSAQPQAKKPSKLFSNIDANFKFAPPKKEDPKPAEPVVDTQPKSIVQGSGIDVKTDDLIMEHQETIGQAEFCEMVTGTVRRYIGPVITNGFIPGHDYLLKVRHTGQTYSVESQEDLTDDETVNIYLHYSSQISINQYFYRLKEQPA